MHPKEAASRVEYIDSICTECVFQVRAYPPISQGEGVVDGGFVGLAGLSSHVARLPRWRERLIIAWRVLRGSLFWDAVYFEDASELDAVVEGLCRARKYAFPEAEEDRYQWIECTTAADTERVYLRGLKDPSGGNP